ncbi:MAG: MnmC family methyltransferase [Bdellovibrionia bacterium]
MHSSIGPWEEANLIYVGQSNLKERLRRHEPGPLIIYDIGLGIAANALALIQAHSLVSNEQSRDVHLISFESDIEGLKYAFNHQQHFPFLQEKTMPFLKENKNLIELISKNFLSTNNQSQRSFSFQSQSGATIKWELRTGNFLGYELESQLPAPELIYFDFYSPKSSPELWNYRTFSSLYKTTEPRRKAKQTSTLLTYTSSTAVRSAMILAGFKVGYGIQTSKKFETTIACTDKNKLTRPLGQEWLEHLARSSKPLPSDYPYDIPSEAIRKISQILKSKSN